MELMKYAGTHIVRRGLNVVKGLLESAYVHVCS